MFVKKCKMDDICEIKTLGNPQITVAVIVQNVLTKIVCKCCEIPVIS